MSEPLSITLGQASIPDGWDSPAVIVAIVGAIANFMVVLAAIGIPLWQARREDHRRALDRGEIRAQVFQAVLSALDLADAVLGVLRTPRMTPLNVIQGWGTVLVNAQARLDTLASREGVLASEISLVYRAKELLNYIQVSPPEHPPGTSAETRQRDFATYEHTIDMIGGQLRAAFNVEMDVVGSAPARHDAPPSPGAKH